MRKTKPTIFLLHDFEKQNSIVVEKQTNNQTQIKNVCKNIEWPVRNLHL